MTGTVPRAVGPARDVDRRGTNPPAYWGVWMLVVTEAMLFAGLLSSYFFLRATSEEWPLGGIEAPTLPWISVFSVVLVSSSLPMALAERAARRGQVGRLRAALAAVFVMGAVFVAYSIREFAVSEFGFGDNAYASVFHTIVGLHLLHVLVGLGMNVGVQAKAWTGRVRPGRDLSVRMHGVYWHFVDAVWVVVFGSLYLSVQWT